MKENLENSIKNSLENFELPYNNGAWESMRTKLDAKMPVQKPAIRRINPYAAVATVAIVSVASYFYFSQLPEESKSKSTGDITTNQNVKSSVNPNNVNNSSTQEVTTENNESISEVQVLDNVLSNVNSTNQNKNNSTKGNEMYSEKGNSNSDLNKQNTTKDSGDITDLNTKPEKIAVPSIPTLCQNDSYIIKNENKNKELILIYPNGTLETIDSKKSLNFKAKNIGTYRIGYKDNNGVLVDKYHFTVNSAPEAEFNIDSENSLEGGLPGIEVTATTIGDNYIWDFEGSTAQGETAFARFYTKGNKTITLTVTNSNGCSDKETKSVYVEEDYNLVAVNAININSPDTRNRVFLPYALTERNVKFKMIIFDREGRVVYETSNADQPWNGIDMKNGKEIDGTDVYTWKVQIFNPEPGERNVYQGSVTVIRN